MDAVQGAITRLDVVVFLSAKEIAVPDSEDRELRRAVDKRLEAILLDDDFGLFTASRPLVVEAFGTTAQRLRIVEAVLR